MQPVQVLHRHCPHAVPLAGLFSLLVACSGFETGGRTPASTHYCDSFLVYDLCARDSNRDGVVDYVYFEDSQRIFMYREGAQSRFPRNYPIHRCITVMDDDLVEITSRLFYIDEETTYLEKQDIRGAMMLKYISYMPEVTACNLGSQDESGADSTRPDV